MQTGDIVKFKDPTSATEARERFTVIELRGDRTLVEFVCALPLPPTFVYPSDQLAQA